jgi:peptidoglycan/xylan/chitin deacetylase (PgdA/CDA1 family)
VPSISLTFDVDAEAGLGAALAGSANRLSTLSEREFGVRRGVPRILELLDRHGLTATFYVPGATATRHPDAIASIAEAGHEIAHHGHHHLRPHELSEAEQERELVDGLEALHPYLGDVVGYRSPAWELTPETARLLVRHGFAYDSSLMGDDRPYRLAAGAGDLVEIPIHWSLDDVIWFEIGRATRPTPPETWRRAWQAEIAALSGTDAHLTLTCHPEIVGRGQRAAELDRLLGDIVSAGVTVLTHRAVAEAFLAVDGRA